MTTDTDNMALAHRLAGQLLRRTMSGWADVYNFRQLGRLGLPHATQKVGWQNKRTMEHIAKSDAYAEAFLVDRATLMEQGFFEKAAADATVQAVATFENALDAASLIFAHSLLDDIVLGWIKVCTLAAPDAFTNIVGEKKYSLKDIQSRHFSALRDNAIELYLADLARASLTKKLDTTFALCRPPSSFSGIDEYKYDRVRLVALDQLRHDYVHNTGPARRLPEGDSDLLFLQKTALYLLSLVSFSFCVKVDVEGFLNPEKRQ